MSEARGLQADAREGVGGRHLTKGFGHCNALQETHQRHHGQPGSHALGEERGMVSHPLGKEDRDLWPGSGSPMSQKRRYFRCGAVSSHCEEHSTEQNTAHSCSASIHNGQAPWVRPRRLCLTWCPQVVPQRDLTPPCPCARDAPPGDASVLAELSCLALSRRSREREPGPGAAAGSRLYPPAPSG